MYNPNPKLVIVMLVASRTNTKWFHDIVFPAVNAGYCHIQFLKGRLKFRNKPDSAPFPSMILIFGKSLTIQSLLYNPLFTCNYNPL